MDDTVDGRLLLARVAALEVAVLALQVAVDVAPRVATDAQVTQVIGSIQDKSQRAP